MAKGRSTLNILICFIFCPILNVVKSQDQKTITIRMPNVKPLQEDTYLCRGLAVDPSVEYFITSYEALANQNTVHHLSVLGCEEPGSSEEYWNCRTADDNSTDSQYYPVCKREFHTGLLFLWANNAGKFEMPKDVGFMIGGKSKIYYIVIQLHYVGVEKFTEEGVTDNSGIRITYTNTPFPKIASIFQIVSGGRILPNSTEYFEVACQMNNEIPIHPIAYRVHTHGLGKVVSGYKAVKGKEMFSEKWTLIGKKDPNLPQAFYPVDNKVEINKGDYLMARCTFFNDRNVTVREGPRAIDEMCMFYIMFWTKTKELGMLPVCHPLGPPYVSWLSYGFMQPPEDASTVPTDDHAYYQPHPFNVMG